MVQPERHGEYLAHTLRFSNQFAPAINEARRRIETCPAPSGRPGRPVAHRQPFHRRTPHEFFVGDRPGRPLIVAVGLPVDPGLPGMCVVDQFEEVTGNTYPIGAYPLSSAPKDGAGHHVDVPLARWTYLRVSCSIFDQAPELCRIDCGTMLASEYDWAMASSVAMSPDAAMCPRE